MYCIRHDRYFGMSCPDCVRQHADLTLAEGKAREKMFTCVVCGHSKDNHAGWNHPYQEEGFLGDKASAEEVARERKMQLSCVICGRTKDQHVDRGWDHPYQEERGIDHSTPFDPAEILAKAFSCPNTGVTFASGAVRSELKPRYDLIPRVALERLAMRYAMGAEKYGDFNYEKGLPLSDTLNHIIDHLLRYKDRMRSGEPMTDDDLAGAMWGCAALMRLEELGKLEV